EGLVERPRPRHVAHAEGDEAQPLVHRCLLRVVPGAGATISGSPVRRGLIGKWLLAYTAPVSDVYRALADPTRRAILDELSERDGQTLFELCSRLAVNDGLR